MTNRIVLSGQFKSSNVLLGKDLHVDGNVEVNGALVKGVSGSGSEETPNKAASTSVAIGKDISAEQEYSIVMGMMAESSAPRTFLWSGVDSQIKVNSGAAGTFKINPANGENGFLIGDESLQTKLARKIDKPSGITAGTNCKITYDSNGLVTSSAALSSSDIPSGIEQSKISGLGDALAGKVDVLANKPTAGTSCKVTYNADGLVTSGTSLSETDMPEEVTSKISQHTNDIAEIKDKIEQFGTPVRFIGKSVKPIEAGAPITELEVYYTTKEGEEKTKIVALKNGDLAVHEGQEGKEFIYLNGTFEEVGEYSNYITKGNVQNSDVPNGTLDIAKTNGLQDALDGKVAKNADLSTTGSFCKITFDKKGLVTGGANLSASDIPSGIAQSKITNLTTDLSKKFNTPSKITSGENCKIKYNEYGLVETSSPLTSADVPTIPMTKVDGLGTALDNKMNVPTGTTATGTFCKVTTDGGIVSSGSSTIETSDVDGLDSTIESLSTLINGKVSSTALTGETLDTTTMTEADKLRVFLKIAGALGVKVTSSISDMRVEFSGGPYIFTGSAITPPFVLKSDYGTVPDSRENYVYSFSNNVNAGTTATVSITGKGSYPGNKTATFEIEPFNGEVNEGNRLEVTTNAESLVYDGQPTPTLSVSILDATSEKGLVEGTDYNMNVVSTETNLTYKLQLHYIGNYKDTNGTYFDKMTFTIKKFEITTTSVTATYPQSMTWNGSAFTPTIEVNAHWGALTKDSDFTVAYEYNTDVQSNNKNGVIVVSGINKCSGTARYEFTKNPSDITGCSFTPIETQTLVDGKAEPEVTIKDAQERTLVKGTDYTLSYSNHEKVGTGTVHITGINNYSSTKDMTFNIVQSLSEASIADMPRFVYTGSEIKPEPEVTI